MDVIIVIGGALLLMYASRSKGSSGGEGVDVSINGGESKNNDLFSWLF